MSTLKKPLHIDKESTCFIRDARDAKAVATVRNIRHAHEIVHCVNCHDDLLAACEAVQTYLSVYGGSSNVTRKCLDVVAAAISKARPEPASRPDVTTEEVR